MNGTVYLKGVYLDAAEAKISIFDRAVLFGDAVYEVAGVLDGKLLDFDFHMARLQRSLGELAIAPPLDRDQLLSKFRKLVELNRVEEGLVYLQITRGEADRDFVYGDFLQPNVFMFTQHKPSSENELASTGVSLQSVNDIRWARRDIKSVNLLGQVLAKQTAHDAGAYEALMVGADGYVTECGATSFFIMRGDVIITRPLSPDILAGVTRGALIELCDRERIRLEQELFTLEDVYTAEEAFIAGASTYVLPVVMVDGRAVGDGKPGRVAGMLRKIYLKHARDGAI